MALQTDTGSEAVHPVRPVRTRSDRWAVLAAGVILALLGTGEPHSIAIAAWLAPVFLLRFVRDSRPVLGLGVVALVGVAASVLWSWKIAVISGLPLAAMALSGAMTVLPYIFDRLAGIRLEPIMRLALFPSVIVALEYAQIKLSPFGTIHGLLVDTQLGDLALLQLSSVVGPTGVGFLIGGFATVLNYLWEVRRAGQWVAIVCALTLLFVIGAGSARISFAPIAGKQTVRIAGITPDTDAVLEQYAAAGYPGRAYLIRPPRFDPDSVRQQTAAIVDDLFSKTRAAAHAGAKIVMWSETAAAVSEAALPAFLSRAQRTAREDNIYLEVTSDTYRKNRQDLNENFLIGPDGTVLWHYRKRHPVPGQEDQFEHGSATPPVVSTPYGRLSSVICFDGDFPALLQVDADIMLIPSADWPEDSPMHTQLAALRGIENGYSVVRTDSSGQSAAFDRYGRILATQDTTVKQTEIWYADVPVRGALTLYRMLGDTLAWLSILAVVILTAVAVAQVKCPRTEPQ